MSDASVWAGVLTALLFSALFSGSETAFLTANKLKVELKRQKGNRLSSILSYFYEHPDRFLSTMLVGNNIALVVFTSLLSIPLTQLLSNIFGIQNEYGLFISNTLFITILLLFFGEFLPKALFRLYANELLYFFAIPLRALQYILFIPSWLMNQTSNLVLRIFLGANNAKNEQEITRTDLEEFIQDTRTETEEGIDKDLFNRALNMQHIRVSECMIPRTEIFHIDVESTVQEALQSFVDSKLSRLLVTDGDIDNVLGYIHHQQLLQNPGNIRELILPIIFIPEVLRSHDLLNRFIKDRITIACVVDEYGALSGLITQEDLLEILFGDIEDEHDEEEYVEEQLSEFEYRFSGRLEISYLNEKYPWLDLPEGEYQTLSGYLVNILSDIPEAGAQIVLNDNEFILEQVTETRIETIRIHKIIQGGDAPSAD